MVERPGKRRWCQVVNGVYFADAQPAPQDMLGAMTAPPAPAPVRAALDRTEETEEEKQVTRPDTLIGQVRLGGPRLPEHGPPAGAAWAMGTDQIRVEVGPAGAVVATAREVPDKGVNRGIAAPYAVVAYR